MFMRSVDGCHEILRSEHVTFYSPDNKGVGVVSLADSQDTVSPLNAILPFVVAKLGFTYRYYGDEKYPAVAFHTENLEPSFVFTFCDEQEKQQFVEFYGLESVAS